MQMGYINIITSRKQNFLTENLILTQLIVSNIKVFWGFFNGGGGGNFANLCYIL